MNKQTLVLTLMLFSACGNGPGKVDPALQPYFDSFTRDVGSTVDGIDAKFDPVLLPVIGFCTHGGGGTPTITIDPTYWKNGTEDQKIHLVYHELGHCALNRGHTESFGANHCPSSIMYPYAFGASKCYIDNKPYYFKELGENR